MRGKESAFLQCRRSGFDPWVGKIPWRGTWQPTPVFLPEQSHGQRSLGGYSPWSHKESGMTEATKQQLSACGHQSLSHSKAPEVDPPAHLLWDKRMECFPKIILGDTCAMTYSVKMGRYTWRDFYILASPTRRSVIFVKGSYRSCSKDLFNFNLTLFQS